jgi:hypothetical protein
MPFATGRALPRGVAAYTHLYTHIATMCILTAASRAMKVLADVVVDTETKIAILFH